MLTNAEKVDVVVKKQENPRFSRLLGPSVTQDWLQNSRYSSVTALDSQFSSILNSFKFPLYLNSSFADASWGSDRDALHQIKGRWLAHGLRTAHHVATALAPPPSHGRAEWKLPGKHIQSEFMNMFRICNT